MSAVVETLKIIPVQQTGAWVAAISIHHEGVEHEMYCFLSPLTEPIEAAQYVVDSNVPRDNARLQFLNDVRLYTKH